MKLFTIITATAVAFSSICSGLAIPSEGENGSNVAKRGCTPYWACRLAPPKPDPIKVVPIDDPIQVVPIEDPIQVVPIEDPIQVVPIADPPFTVVPIGERTISFSGGLSSILSLGPSAHPSTTTGAAGHIEVP